MTGSWRNIAAPKSCSFVISMSRENPRCRSRTLAALGESGEWRDELLV